MAFQQVQLLKLSFFDGHLLPWRDSFWLYLKPPVYCSILHHTEGLYKTGDSFYALNTYCAVPTVYSGFGYQA